MSRRNVLTTLATVLLTALLPMPKALMAQSPPAILNLNTVAKLADTNGLEIQASRQNVAAAQKRIQQAQALRLGKVEANAGYLRYSDPISITSPAVSVPFLGGVSLAVPPTLLAPQDSQHVILQAGLPLFTGGRISNTIREAREGERAAESAHEDTRMGSIFEAEQYYLGALLTREVVRLNEQALHSYEKHLSDARVAFRSGVVATYDLIRAETAVKEQEKRLTEVRNEYDVTEAALRTALTMPDEAPLSLDGALFEIGEPVALQQLQQEAVAASPALSALAHKVEALRRAERVEQGNYLPTITAVAGKELTTAKIAQTDPHWFAGVQANLSLFEGGARRARVGEKAADMAKARIEYRHASDQVLLAIRRAFLQLDSQHSALQSAKKAEELAEESLRLATKRFGVGTGTSLEVLDANVALTGSRIGVQTSLYRIDLAYLQIHRYVGDLQQAISKVQQ